VRFSIAGITKADLLLLGVREFRDY